MDISSCQHEHSGGEKLNALFHNIFQNASNGILILDSNIKVVYANHFMLDNFDFTDAGLCLHTQDCNNCIIRNSLGQIFCDGAVVDSKAFSYTRLINAKETPKWYIVSGNPFYFNNDTYGILTFVDISLYKYKEQQLMKRLELDLSTNTLNKHSLIKKINQLLISGNPKHFSLCMLDFDYFKEINDLHGHIIGDEVLKTFSHITRKFIKSKDIIGRYGGEEFIIVFPNLDLEDAVNVIISIQKEVKNYFSGLLQYPVSFSAGMVHIETYQSFTCKEIIKRADRLLYKAKENGKNRIVTVNKEYMFI